MRWLSDDTIDLAAKIIVNKTANYYMSNCLAQMLFVNSECISQITLINEKRFSFHSLNLKSYNYIFIVLNIRAHWILLVVDMKCAILYWMDPYKSKFTNDMYLNKWKALVGIYDKVNGTDLSSMN